MLKSLKEKINAYIVWLGIIVFFLALYGIVNHLPLQRYSIPFMFREDLIPFLPWTFIIYLSIFFQYFIVVKKIPSEKLTSLFIKFSFVMASTLILFIVFPIEYPRYLYPSTGIINFFRATDGPGNCFPSLHVIETVLLAACYWFLEKSTWRRLIMTLWSVLIIISVLTTKQHYIIDIIGGIVLVSPFIFIMRKDLIK